MSAFHTRVIDTLTKPSQIIDTLKHGDIFTSFVMPQMMHPREGWEDLSDKEKGKMVTVDDCRSRCPAQPDCRQYSLDQGLVCRTRVDPKLGKVAKSQKRGTRARDTWRSKVKPGSPPDQQRFSHKALSHSLVPFRHQCNRSQDT
jgi:hypothetical protein